MNSSKPLGVRLAALGAALVVILALGTGPAGAAMTEAEVTRMIEETYGVQVLRVRAERLDEDWVWLVTVMNPPGDFNEAFQVNTLAVDRASGNLISQYRYTGTGHVLSGADSRSPSTDESGAVIRQRSTRGVRSR